LTVLVFVFQRKHWIQSSQKTADALFACAMADGSNLAPDLRKRIEIMADHIARNGSDFEATVKQKNVNNPQFAFLYNGEGSEYYQQVLAKQRGTTAKPPVPTPPPQAPASLSNLLRGQVNESVATGNAGGSLANLLRIGQVNPQTQPQPLRPVPPVPPNPMPIPVPPQNMYLGQRPLGQLGQLGQPGQLGQLGARQGQVPMPNLRQADVRSSGFQAAPMRIGVPPGPQTPETVPVGILSNMLGAASKNIRYKPLDPAVTPQTLPFEVPTAHMLAKVEEFYDELRDEERDSSSTSSSRSRSRGRDTKDYSGRSGCIGFSIAPPPMS